MKRLLAAALAASMVLGMALTTMAAYGDTFKGKDGEDHDYSDIFRIDQYSGSDGGVLTPGKTYYFPCTWSGADMTDEFFEYYDYSISIRSGYDRDDKESYKTFSDTAAKQRVEVAEFEKDENGKYVFKFRAKATYGYTDDVPISIGVFCKDKRDSDYRGVSELDLSVGYVSNKSPVMVSSSPYEVGRGEPMIEFEEDLKSIRLEFDEGSYINFNLTTKARKFNFLYTDAADTALVNANPGAKLKFLTFTAQPQPGGNGVLKINAPGTKYLYQMDENGALTLLSQDNNNDFFGISVTKLGSYVASDRQLTAASTTAAPPPGDTSTSTSTTTTAPTGTIAPAGSGQTTGTIAPKSSLETMVSQYFSNKFVTMSYGDSYEAIASTGLKAQVDLTGFDATKLKVYAYNETTNQLVEMAKANAQVGADGFLYFNVVSKGQYVICEGPLTAK